MPRSAYLLAVHQTCCELYITAACAGDAMQCAFRSDACGPPDHSQWGWFVHERTSVVVAEGTGAPTSLSIIPEMHACLLQSLSDGTLHHRLPYSIRQHSLTLDEQVEPWPPSWSMCHHAPCPKIIFVSLAPPVGPLLWSHAKQ